MGHQLPLLPSLASILASTMDGLIRVDDGTGVITGADVGGLIGVAVLVPHLHTGSINEHAQFCKSDVVCPFAVMNFEYKH
jgi:hypothetical protein